MNSDAIQEMIDAAFREGRRVVPIKADPGGPPVLGKPLILD